MQESLEKERTCLAQITLKWDQAFALYADLLNQQERAGIDTPGQGFEKCDEEYSGDWVLGLRLSVFCCSLCGLVAE